MKLGYQTNTWGGVVGHPMGVTSIKDLWDPAFKNRVGMMSDCGVDARSARVRSHDVPRSAKLERELRNLANVVVIIDDENRLAHPIFCPIKSLDGPARRSTSSTDCLASSKSPFL